MRTALVMVAALCSLGEPVRGQDAAALSVGDRLDSSRSLRDVRGNRRSIQDLRGYSAYVVVFLGTECPLANLYVPRLVSLEAEHRPKVKFIGVYPNASEFDWPEGWSVEPDVVTPIPEPIDVPADGVMDYVGLAKVRAEWDLVCSALNLGRMSARLEWA